MLSTRVCEFTVNVLGKLYEEEVNLNTLCRGSLKHYNLCHISIDMHWSLLEALLFCSLLKGYLGGLKDMVIKFREFHRKMSVKATYDYSLFILKNLYKCWFELFGLIYSEVFSKFTIYSSLNIKQGSSIVIFSWSVFNIVSW